MKLLRPSASATFLALLSILSSCSSGGEDGGGPMFVQTCSLGCSSGQGGSQVTCTIVTTYVNQDISVLFSEPVNPASISSGSLQIIDVNSGAVPVGERFLDPLNPRKVIFRPAINFDAQGNPTFGLANDRTYRVTVPGSAQDPNGPFIQSTSGAANRSRLLCEIRTTLGTVDPVPGSPVVEVFVDQAIVATPNPDDIIPNVPAANASDVWRNTTVRMVFNDLMNPSTLASPTTGQSPFVTVNVQLGDGITLVPLQGNFVASLDMVTLQTVLIFTPSGGLPSSGSPELNPVPRKIVVTIPDSLLDLVGNELANPQILSFTPEFVPVNPVTLPDEDGENFVDDSNHDISRSSADWSAGRLTRGFSGGSGRLGELRVLSGQTVTIDTDATEFPLGVGALQDVLDNSVPGVDYDELDRTTWPKINVTDGAFEFSRVVVDGNAVLRLTGSQPARVLSRGNVVITGTLDVGGETPAPHVSTTPTGGLAGEGGPNAGSGGIGATRNDTENAALIAAGGVNLAFPADTNGQPGIGIGNVPGGFGAPEGGPRFPDAFPLSQVTQPATLGDLRFSDIDLSCLSRQVASGGGGGGYALAGEDATPVTPTATATDGTPNLPSGAAFIAAGGSALPLEPADPESGHFIRRLEFTNGFLRGGSGGGGGGASLYETSTSGGFGVCTGIDAPIDNFRDHSGAGGGGGGGALALLSGRSLLVSGLINAAGGNGGSASTTLLPDITLSAEARARPTRAAPGGGGSGGSVRLQASDVQLPIGNPPRVSVAGGAGGTNSLGSTGGDASPGLVRIEDRTGTLTRAGVAPAIGPTFPSDPESKDIVSVGAWVLPRVRPASFSAASSCWMKPEGNFFQIVFEEDNLAAPLPADRYGWNMQVIYDSGSGPQLINYRGPDPNSPFGSGDFETNVGNQINYDVPAGVGSYFAVRFQGAQAGGTLADPCNVTLTGPGIQITPNSLTPWVMHPAQLNEFSPRPNMLRFCIVFDTSLVQPASLPFFIKGVTNLKINAQPD